jgi:ABC-type nitrate/sulfonate/bicarbonate transport system substrate-binding protein
MPDSLTPIRAITFGGGYNLPAWIAQKNGYFAGQGIAVDLTYTPDSVYLMKSLIEGEFDVALTAIDNLIAYQEGQGEAEVSRPVDLAAFMGMDSGFLELVARPRIGSVEALRGCEIAVDALTTGFAFVLREMLVRAGLRDEDVVYVRAGGSPKRLAGLLENRFAATLLPTPFALQAEERGFRILGSGKAFLGRYQGRCAFAQRSWLKRNEPAVIGLMRAYAKAMDWIFDPANANAAQAVLVENDRGLTPALAKRTYDLFVDPEAGLFRDLALDLDGIGVVLELRSKFATPPRELADPASYIDVEYYRKAFGPQR